jgi:hypothetical protein
MKTSFLALLIIFFSFTEHNKPDIRLSILNTNIRDDEKITFQIENNSKNNYCFLMDTVFPIRSTDYFKDVYALINPKLTIYDSQNKTNSIWLKDVSYDENSQNSTNLNNYSHNQKHVKEPKLSLIFVKVNSSVKMKMPFHLVVRETEEMIVYYKLNDSEKYKCQIEYSIEKEVITKRISSRVMDSIKKKDYTFFTGKIVSNKVPLICK